jgi:hypothetical protein
LVRLLVETPNQHDRRDGAVCVLAQLDKLVLRRRLLQSEPDPAEMADVRGTEETRRVFGDQFGLYAGWGGQAQVWKLDVVVAFGPDRGEGILAADEEGWSAVTGALDHLRKVLDRASDALHVCLVTWHAADFRRRRGR